MKKKSFLIGAISDTGLIKKTNQDKILVKIGENNHGDFGLFIVADGMGGLAAGDIASSIAVEIFNDWWSQDLSNLLPIAINDIDIIAKDLRKVFHRINNEIIRYGSKNGNRAGTTLSALLLYKDYYVIQHIGDTRIYKVDKRLTLLTVDHSWVGEQIRQGSLTIEEAKKHPKRNLLTQCLGVNQEFVCYQTIGRIEEGAKFLVCSDGFYSQLLDEEIIEGLNKGYLHEDDEVQEKVKDLFQIVKIRGASDNISAIFIVPKATKGRKLLKSLVKIITS